MENENNGNGKMENIFYAALALHVAGKPLNKENIRVVLRSAGTPVDEPALDIIGAFIESFKVSNGKNNDSGMIKLLTTVLSRQNGSTEQLEKLLGELNKAVSTDSNCATLLTGSKKPETEESATISQNIGRYVYGITAGGKEVKLGPIGIDGSEVYTVSYQNLGAIVHSCPAEPYQSTDDETVKRWVRTHQSVLDAAKKEFNVIIPLGFDTILKPGDDYISADQVVRDWLKKDSDPFHAVISQIEGKDEYAVQISYNPPAICKYMSEPSDEVKTIREKLSKKSPGIAYLYKQRLEKAIKADMERLADTWFKDFYSKVNKYTDGIIVEKTKKLDKDKVMLLNLSCLVAREKVDGLGEELEKINGMEGFSVHFSGPWPPYSFVAKPVIAAGKEGSNGSH